MSEVKEIKKRIDFLDYLKAICVIMVIITHYDWGQPAFEPEQHQG